MNLINGLIYYNKLWYNWSEKSVTPNLVTPLCLLLTTKKFSKVLSSEELGPTPWCLHVILQVTLHNIALLQNPFFHWILGQYLDIWSLWSFHVWFFTVAAWNNHTWLHDGCKQCRHKTMIDTRKYDWSNLSYWKHNQWTWNLFQQLSAK